MTADASTRISAARAHKAKRRLVQSAPDEPETRDKLSPARGLLLAAGAAAAFWAAVAAAVVVSR